jgi:FKBP-type peptidyl-prolyl cis-trans isomerase 2
VLFPKLVLLTLIFSLWIVSPDSVNAAEFTDWGDVVNVNYSLYYDAEHTNSVAGNVDNTIEFIYLTTTNSVPPEIQGMYPEASAGFLGKFKEGIVGMQIGTRRNVKIDASDAYTDPNHSLYGIDLYFVIRLLDILYSASENENTNTIVPSQDFSALIFISGFVAILGGGLVLWSFRSSRAMKSALSDDEMSSSLRVKTIQKDKVQLKDLRELTESLTNSEESMKKQDVKFRRRRK